MKNKYMNAVPSFRRKPNQPKPERTVRLEKNWERHGLIWRTLATYSEALGRTPCRSSSPRRRLKRVLRAIQCFDVDEHFAAA